ncbi:MFS transporter [Corynebacterium cystitidis]|uniref:MFS transporter n=1 Tax=Corynebacterium cystitidis TaxID=35757 RepID=UPI00211DAEBC|nr:MFS transporter [Corynebacterium cystitidis]
MVMRNLKALQRPLGSALMFITNGISVGALLPWYPTLKQQADLSDAVYGFVVTAVAVGSLLATFLPAWAERNFGARPVMVVGTVATAILLATIGFSHSLISLVVALMLFGLFDAIIDVSQNVAAVRIQHDVGVSFMSSLHACWSLGAVLGGLSATTAAVFGMGLQTHLVIIAAVQILLALIAATMMGEVGAPPDESVKATGNAGDAETTKRSAAITGRALLIALPAAVVALSGSVVEDIGNNWAPLSANVVAGVRLEAAGVAYMALFAAHMIGRFAGDVLINRFGRVPIARWGGISILLGGVCVVVDTQPWLLFLGYAFAGWGAATLIPSAYAVSAELPGVAQSTGLTIVSWIMRAGALLASPILGVISELTTLRVALLVLPVIGVAVVVSSQGLRSHQSDS